MKSEKARKYIEDWTFDATSLVDADGIGAIVLRRYEAVKAVEIAEQEAEERVRIKAHKIVKEMMDGIFHGNMPQKIADEFIQKLNDNGND